MLMFVHFRLALLHSCLSKPYGETPQDTYSDTTHPIYGL